MSSTDTPRPCRHRHRHTEQEYRPTSPSMSEMFDRLDQREHFYEFRYWCGACGTTLSSGRTWAM